MHCLDFGESFPTHIVNTIFLQKLASIQPLTSPVKFARSPRIDPLIITDPPGTCGSNCSRCAAVSRFAAYAVESIATASSVSSYGSASAYQLGSGGAVAAVGDGCRWARSEARRRRGAAAPRAGARGDPRMETGGFPRRAAAARRPTPLQRRRRHGSSRAAPLMLREAAFLGSWRRRRG